MPPVTISYLAYLNRNHMAYIEQRMQAGGWGGGGLPYATCHNQLFGLPQQKPYGLHRTADAGWGMGGGGGYHMPPVTISYLAYLNRNHMAYIEQRMQAGGWGGKGGATICHLSQSVIWLTSTETIWLTKNSGCRLGDGGGGATICHLSQSVIWLTSTETIWLTKNSGCRLGDGGGGGATICHLSQQVIWL